MFGEIRNPMDTEVVPLQSAVLCLDCEAVSNSPGDECPACRSRSLVSLARMLGGSVQARKASRLQNRESLLFDLRMNIELKRMEARDLNVTIDGIAGLIWPRLGRDRASFHIDVEPTVNVGTVDQKAA